MWCRGWRGNDNSAIASVGSALIGTIDGQSVLIQQDGVIFGAI